MVSEKAIELTSECKRILSSMITSIKDIFKINSILSLNSLYRVSVNFTCARFFADNLFRSLGIPILTIINYS